MTSPSAYFYDKVRQLRTRIIKMLGYAVDTWAAIIYEEPVSVETFINSKAWS